MRLAALDERDGNKAAALTNAREALLAFDGQRELNLAKQRLLWKDLARSDEDWQAWVDSISRPAWRHTSIDKRRNSTVGRQDGAETLELYSFLVWDLHLRLVRSRAQNV